MGEAKRQMEEDDEKRNVAIGIAVEVGVLEQCELCDEITDTQAVDIVEAYKKANYLIGKNDPRVAIFNGNGRELTDILKDIQNDFGADCQCDRRMKED